jgi:hypothetical protein
MSTFRLNDDGTLSSIDNGTDVPQPKSRKTAASDTNQDYTLPVPGDGPASTPTKQDA